MAWKPNTMCTKMSLSLAIRCAHSAPVTLEVVDSSNRSALPAKPACSNDGQRSSDASLGIWAGQRRIPCAVRASDTSRRPVAAVVDYRQSTVSAGLTASSLLTGEIHPFSRHSI
jgi:hypothetical protein